MFKKAPCLKRSFFYYIALKIQDNDLSVHFMPSDRGNILFNTTIPAVFCDVRPKQNE